MTNNDILINTTLKHNPFREREKEREREMKAKVFLFVLRHAKPIFTGLFVLCKLCVRIWTFSLSAFLRIKTEYGKIRIRKIPKIENFYAVVYFNILNEYGLPHAIARETKYSFEILKQMEYKSLL